MSDDSSQKPEPTTEEILASIRRIIADEEEGKSDVPPAGKPDPHPEPAGAEEIAREVAASQEAAPDEEDDADDILELTERVGGPEDTGDEASSAQEPEPPAVAAETPAEPEPGAAVEDATLVSTASAGAVTGSFAELARALDREPEAVRNMALGEGNSLEDVVKEQIRPMLREWLDENLPALVEQLVRMEIQRMVRRAEDQ